MYFGCSKEPSHRDGFFSTPIICFGLEIRKIIFCYALLSGGLFSLGAHVFDHSDGKRLIPDFHLGHCPKKALRRNWWKATSFFGHMDLHHPEKSDVIEKVLYR